MMMKKNLLHLSCILLSCFFTSAQTTLHVGPGQQYANPAQAASNAHPGDTILIHNGIYNGAFFIENLKGTAKAWIYIRGQNTSQVIFQGGSEALHFIDPAFVHLSDITITGQTGNGINIDDGGTYTSPANHMIINHVIFKDMAANGNNDMLKLSGLDSFEVLNCVFENGSAGGSGIDMVGCHYGHFYKNQFTNQGSNSIQIKGGSANIFIERNRFTNGGLRAINLGGSTDTPYFRPFGANYEAKDLLVTANIFEGGDTPVAFVGSRNVQVINNTIIEPTVWVFRILQESSDTSFYLSVANNTFSNNIVLVSSLRSDVNIGPYTSPETFKFANNLWYHLQNPNWIPQLPAPETGGITKQSPQFNNFAAKDYSLSNNSPAIAKGKFYAGYTQDYKDSKFLIPPSIGAFEKNTVIAVNDYSNKPAYNFYPVPFHNELHINNSAGELNIYIYNATGNFIKKITTLDSQALNGMESLPAGYYLFLVDDGSKQQLINIIKSK
jgi:hypothetical protein